MGGESHSPPVNNNDTEYINEPGQADKNAQHN